MLKKLESSFKPARGIFTLYSIENGKKEKLVEDKNIIVNDSFDILTGLLTGDNDKRITTLALGNGGIINSEIQSPTINDKTLYNEFFRKTNYENTVIEKILTPNFITFIFRIGLSEANGSGAASIINEAGLLAHDGTMFSRKTFAEIIKTPQKELSIEWRLEWE